MDTQRFEGADPREIGEPARWWHREGERVRCTLCPRSCSLREGDRGFCFVRRDVGGELRLTSYGYSTGFSVDPIEKKPLFHFLPGTTALSFGTPGCNLGCKFCQNWEMTKAREVARMTDRATPEEIAAAAAGLGASSVAFTYNDPIIWAEYAIDVARACRARGIKAVAVTNGFISDSARAEFFGAMDAANVDLKGFSEEFYRRLTLSHLEPVLETLIWLAKNRAVWLEITNLIIPRENDDPALIRSMCEWISAELGVDVPLHFSRFFPDFKLTDHPITEHRTLIDAYDIAAQAGLRYVYLGNVYDPKRQTTRCPSCRRAVIERGGRETYSIDRYGLEGGRCIFCGGRVAGVFGAAPSAGAWPERPHLVQLTGGRADG